MFLNLRIIKYSGTEFWGVGVRSLTLKLIEITPRRAIHHSPNIYKLTEVQIANNFQSLAYNSPKNLEDSDLQFACIFQNSVLIEYDVIFPTIVWGEFVSHLQAFIVLAKVVTLF